MLDGYLLEDVGHIRAPIGGTLYMPINLTPLNNMSHICEIIKKLSQR